MVIHFPLYFTLRSPFYTLLFHYRFRQHGFYDFSPFIPPHTLLQCLKATYTLPVIWQFFHLFPNTSSSSEALSMFLVIFITSNNDENSVFRLGTRHPSLNRAENCSRIWTSHLRLYARSMLLLLLIEGFILPYAVQLGCWLYHAAERSVRLLWNFHGHFCWLGIYATNPTFPRLLQAILRVRPTERELWLIEREAQSTALPRLIFKKFVVNVVLMDSVHIFQFFCSFIANPILPFNEDIKIFSPVHQTVRSLPLEHSYTFDQAQLPLIYACQGAEHSSWRRECWPMRSENNGSTAVTPKIFLETLQPPLKDFFSEHKQSTLHWWLIKCYRFLRIIFIFMVHVDY